jgi:protein-ribulosamine 3-kinase
MSTDAFFQAIARQIREATGKKFALHKAVAVGGGCINSTYRLEVDIGSYFVKLNRKERLPMFEAELSGLAEIAATHTVRVPQPICCGVIGDKSYLAMEYLELRPAGGSCNRLLGQQLAALHVIDQPFFGWHRDNTIGSSPQPNTKRSDWIEFYTQQRLGFQLKLAETLGFGGKLQRQGEMLMERLPDFFISYQPKPSLLHGDLWGGNYAADKTGVRPVIFDPACYYGDREADIAMTELFGGFGRDFQATYAETCPLDEVYPIRKTLYNLYHIINHLNLFGGGYLAQAESMIAQLLAEVH